MLIVNCLVSQEERLQRRRDREEGRKTIKLQDENQVQTVTAMIEAKRAERGGVEQHTVYDKNELEEIKRVNLSKERERKDIINRGENCS